MQRRKLPSDLAALSTQLLVVALLPLIALFYMAATLQSAVNRWRGTAARWKEREYAA